MLPCFSCEKRRSPPHWPAPRLLALGATSLLPARVALVARAVEQVRGRRFERPVPASEILPAELKRVLKSKVAESFPAAPEETLRTLAAFGFIEETPKLLDKLVDFYASQVIAFYDPEPRRFYVVRGIDKTLEKQEAEAVEGTSAMAERLIFAHELTHALQDETLKLDKRMKELKDNGDRALALESLLEGEATVVMVRVALAGRAGSRRGSGKDARAAALRGSPRTRQPPEGPSRILRGSAFLSLRRGDRVRAAHPEKRGLAGRGPRLGEAPLFDLRDPSRERRFPPPDGSLAGRRGSARPRGSRLLYTDTIGEWSVRFLLRRSLETEEADLAAAGWRGDRIAFFSSERGISYLWRVALESPEAAERFEAAWKKARHKKESVLRKGAEVLVTAGFEKVPDLLK